MTEVSICVCTLRRPAGLARLLDSLGNLDPASPSHTVIVVDNDADATARPVVQKARAQGLPVQYAVEPVRGIARARNRSLALATGRYIAFIDDDEEAAPEWLRCLWQEVVRCGAHGGVGPVVPKVPVAVPQWRIDGGFFERLRFPTGVPLKAELTRMGNALVERQALLGLPGPFDERYNFTGGEDGDVFARMVDAGRRFIAVDSAIVYEHLTPRRTTVRWLLMRKVRTSIDKFRLRAAGVPVRWRRLRSARLVAMALVEGFVGLLVFPVARVYGFGRMLLAAEHVGHFMFLNGLTCRPYLKDSWL